VCSVRTNGHVLTHDWKRREKKTSSKEQLFFRGQQKTTSFWEKKESSNKKDESVNVTQFEFSGIKMCYDVRMNYKVLSKVAKF
jgi:hypothetical protein